MKDDKRALKKAKGPRYLLPSSIIFFLISIANQLIPPRKTNWLLLAIAAVYAVNAAIRDYKRDGEFGPRSVICIIANIVCIAFFIFLAYIIKNTTVIYP